MLVKGATGRNGWNPSMQPSGHNRLSIDYGHNATRTTLEICISIPTAHRLCLVL